MNNEKTNNQPHLNLPAMQLRLKREGSLIKVFDRLRKKFVAFTPEENVRQHFVNWLCEWMHYPTSLMNNEVSLTLNGTNRRCDTVVFNRDGQPLMIIEYKAPQIEISQETFDQIVRYNMVLKAKYLVVSNGIRHFCCIINYTSDSYHFIPSIPDWHSIAIGFSEN